MAIEKELLQQIKEMSELSIVFADNSKQIYEGLGIKKEIKF